jgi:anti-sigma B factor antagonist
MFEAVVSQEGSVRTIALNGECDLQAFPDIDELITNSLSKGFSCVRIDLRGLTFIDSSGIRAVVLAVERSKQERTRVSIIRGPRNVMRVFELVGLLERLPFEEPFDRTRRSSAD